jgi:hypothetical protein
MTRAILALACFPLTLSLAPADVTRLNAGEALVEVLPADDPTVAMRAATLIDSDGRQLVARTRRVERLQAGPYMSAVRRFSDPPRIEDLAQLSLDDEDLLDLRRCRAARCGLKLDDAEMARARHAIRAAGADWRPAAQAIFREIVLTRVRTYIADGHTSATASYHDRKTRVLLDSEFGALAADMALAYPQFFRVTNYLALYPKGDGDGIESFFYWSKDSLGAKPIVSVTQVAMLESPNPRARDALVARKQVYASHYITASLSLTAIGSAPDGDARYLIYINHTRADVFDGLFGGLIRRMVEKRVRAEGPRALEHLRRRLESPE